jgi:murein DD-endopeptidase MepM/ murein hydrolase activator NlpD
VQDGGRDEATGSAARSGLEILQGPRERPRDAQGGEASARAVGDRRGSHAVRTAWSAAQRVTRTATARDGGVTFAGAVSGLVIDGVERADRAGAGKLVGGRRARDRQPRRRRADRAAHARRGRVRVGHDGADRRSRRGGGRRAPTPPPRRRPRPRRRPSHPDPPAPAPGGDEGGDDGDDPPAATPKPKPTAAERLARGRFVFPVYGDDVRCADDFGAARQIGAHQGNDCFAPFGSPVLAVADGTLNRVGTLPISGNRLWLKTERGDAFFYAHLSAFGPEAVSGRKVRAGTLLGFVGNTGDAEPTPPHVHFEIHPGDKKRSTPTRSCGRGRRRRGPTGGWLARYGTDTEERPGALVEVRDFIAGE